MIICHVGNQIPRTALLALIVKCQFPQLVIGLGWTMGFNLGFEFSGAQSLAAMTLSNHSYLVSC